MNIVFEYQHVSGSKRLEDLASEKLQHLSTKFSFVTRADVFFNKENRKDDSGHICSIRLSAPGPRLFASSDEDSFELAISETVRDLNDLLEKRKSKMQY